MKELCESQIEGKMIPSWVVDGGYWFNGTTMIGVCEGAPRGIERITEWELKDRLVTMHNANSFVDENGDPLTQGEVETLSDDFYSSKMPSSDWDDVRLYRNKLLSQADERIMRYDEQTDLGLTPDDDGVAYTAYNTTGYSDRNALLWYKQDLRDITDNYGSVASVVWPDEPA